MSTPPNPEGQQPEAPQRKVPRIPELAGATSAPFQLSGPVTQVAIAVQEPTGPASAGAEELANWEPRRVFLNIEQVLCETGSPPIEVYLNVPANDKPQEHPELRAGSLPMFGLREASIADERHSPTGLDAQLEVTRLYARLALMNNFDPARLHVSFVPRHGGNPPPVRVGRVSLYFA